MLHHIPWHEKNIFKKVLKLERNLQNIYNILTNCFLNKFLYIVNVTFYNMLQKKYKKVQKKCKKSVKTYLLIKKYFLTF